MRHVFRVLLPLLVIIIFVNFYLINPDTIESVDNYPIWMKDSSGNQTEQTSGLFFVGENEGKKIFISCDDIGRINRLSVDENTNPPALIISAINFSDEVNSLLQKFKKKDMEDIFYDSRSNKIYLSIEGHEYSSLDSQIYKQKEGIYEITFNNNILTFDTLLTIKRLQLPEEIYAHTFDNIGFEGFTATENNFFIGLENLQVKNDNFSDSTILYILNRKTNELKEIGTSDLGISTICGLYAKDDYNLYGIDRNRRRMFYIIFNADFTVSKTMLKEINLSIPQHKDINQILGIAPESITFDDHENIYVSVDPWKDLYKADLANKKKLSDGELFNFHKKVPILYKFKNNFND